MPRQARFYPELVPESRRADPRYRAEVRFYDLLDRQLPAGWTVFSNVAWLGRRRHDGGLWDGESDFILAHPVHGVLVAELKGGGVAFDGPRQQWLSTDARGETHDVKNPFKQAADGKHHLRGRLGELLGYDAKAVRLCHAVVFPDCDRSAEAVTEEAIPELMVGRQDLGRLTERLREVLRHSLGADLFLNGPAIVGGLVQLLARTARLPNPLRSQVAAEYAEIQTLTDSQIDLFRRLQGCRRLAVGGGAGSGKTYVAVQRARDLARQGFRTLLVCHAAPLGEYLRGLTAGQADLDAMTAGELSRKFAPGPDPTPDSGDAEERIAGRLFDAVAGLPERPYQAVLIDEGQDFTPAWFTALEACLDGGPAGVLTVFHDTNNQSVRPGRGVLPSGMLTFELRENVRNTQRICRAMRPHYRSEVAIEPRGPDGRAVSPQPYASRAELASRLGAVLTQLLLGEGLPADEVVVLTPRDPLSASDLPAVGLPSGIRLVTDPKAVRGRSVLLSSVADFKGLERAAVVVAELDERLPADPRARAALMYVAFSRPRSVLYLLGTPAVLDELT